MVRGAEAADGGAESFEEAFGAAFTVGGSSGSGGALSAPGEGAGAAGSAKFREPPGAALEAGAGVSALGAEVCCAVVPELVSGAGVAWGLATSGVVAAFLDLLFFALCVVADGAACVPLTGETDGVLPAFAFPFPDEPDDALPALEFPFPDEEDDALPALEFPLADEEDDALPALEFPFDGSWASPDGAGGGVTAIARGAGAGVA